MKTFVSSPETISILSCFHPFPRLPQELQCEIWKIASLEPRTVKLLLKPHLHPTFLDRDGQPHHSRVFCLDPVPGCLHASHGSRAIAKTVYTRPFTTEPKGRFIWVNLDVDTIRVPPLVLASMDVQDLAKIRKIMIEVGCVNAFYSACSESLFELESVVQLDLITEDELRTCKSGLTKVGMQFGMWFGGREGWKIPEIKVIESKTGKEMRYIPKPGQMHVSFLPGRRLRQRIMGRNGGQLGNASGAQDMGSTAGSTSLFSSGEERITEPASSHNVTEKDA